MAEEKMDIACEDSKQNPAEENLFRQLRLNQWVKQSIRWMPMDKWDECSFEVDQDELLYLVSLINGGIVCLSMKFLNQSINI